MFFYHPGFVGYFLRAIFITLVTTALTINPVLAQSGEQTTQESTGFYTDTCQVKIDQHQEVLTLPCLYFAMTIGVSYANFHFGFSGWSQNLVGFVLNIPEPSESNVRKTPILAVFFAENGQVTEAFEGEGHCQEIDSPVYIVSCEFTANDSPLTVQATAQQTD